MRQAQRERDGIMRFAPMRRVAWAIYRVHDIATMLTPLVVFGLAFCFALFLMWLEDGAR
jgi:hypothetical protein